VIEEVKIIENDKTVKESVKQDKEKSGKEKKK